ncbi:ribonuclease III [Candidatus Saccharibacteria bacterium]|nr:ribonuclease III [Candidatus Saccharibacteria bacterium]
MFNQAEVEKVLGIKFKDAELVKTAFTHRSYLNEHRRAKIEHNERLEFLGDAVLELVVTDYLFCSYPDKPEGELTSWRSALVKTESLAELAEILGLGQYLLMSRGEAKSGGRNRVALLANLVEATLGAIYMDTGYDAASKFIHDHIIVKLPGILKEGAHIDAKSHFQEIAQERDGITPSYQVLEESGPDHDKQFIMGVYLGKKLLGKGGGSSKQAAQQAAAAKALEKYEK